MKNKRQNKILELIEKYDIETQDVLIERLRQSGYEVTQATVSRDIRELKLAKIMTGSGIYKYSLPGSDDGNAVPKFSSSLAESIKKVDFAGNIIVLRTYPGMANAVATGIDAIHMSEILGCVAGDDTIIVVVRDADVCVSISEKIKMMIKTI